MARSTGETICALFSVVSVVRAAAAAAAAQAQVAQAPAGADDIPSPPVWPGKFHTMASWVRNGDYGVVDFWYDYDAGHNLVIVQTQGYEKVGPLFDNERANGTTYYYHPAEKSCHESDYGVGLIRPDWLKGATFLGEEECGIYQCYKWEQGEIPEAHPMFLILGTSGVDSPPSTTAGDQAQESSWSIFSQMRAMVSAAMGAMGGESLRGRDRREEGGVSLSWGDAKSEVRRNGDRFLTYWSEKGTDRPVRMLFFNGGDFQVIRFDEGATMPDHAFQIPAYCFEEAEHVP